LVNVAERFAANLFRIRRSADLSQEELAVMASLHRTEISQLERAQRTPRIDTLVKLASSLEVEVDELLEGIEWSPGVPRPGRFRLDEDSEG
jgi:transcriptional regulator with XRE-family HTH domain